MADSRQAVFVSYAREDREWADELRTYLSPGIRERRLRLFDDSQIPAGSNWRDEIETELQLAAVSVLLV